ncbi:DUF1761 domain-containing protein [Stappia sp.]|uniref:DUF1761 domain-containing protein n=1 Tax=Stappia sp. TaxID=1870903 RepID=UPI003A9A4F5A
MEILNVLAAAAASYAFGAIWYMTLARPWMAAANVEVGPDGRPTNSDDKVPYLVAAGTALVVAGMMRHIFELGGIDTIGKGLVAGLGLGLFIASPWIAANNAFGGRPFRLTLIDGGYATIGCVIIGLVLAAF